MRALRCSPILRRVCQRFARKADQISVATQKQTGVTIATAASALLCGAFAAAAAFVALTGVALAGCASLATLAAVGCNFCQALRACAVRAMRRGFVSVIERLRSTAWAACSVWRGRVA